MLVPDKRKIYPHLLANKKEAERELKVFGQEMTDNIKSNVHNFYAFKDRKMQTWFIMMVDYDRRVMGFVQDKSKKIWTTQLECLNEFIRKNFSPSSFSQDLGFVPVNETDKSIFRLDKNSAVEVDDPIWIGAKGEYTNSQPYALQIFEMPDFSMVKTTCNFVCNGYYIPHTDLLPEADLYIFDDCHIGTVDMPRGNFAFKFAARETHAYNMHFACGTHIDNVLNLPSGKKNVRIDLSCTFGENAAFPPYIDLRIDRYEEKIARWMELYGSQYYQKSR